MACTLLERKVREAQMRPCHRFLLAELSSPLASSRSRTAGGGLSPNLCARSHLRARSKSSVVSTQEENSTQPACGDARIIVDLPRLQVPASLRVYVAGAPVVLVLTDMQGQPCNNQSTHMMVCGRGLTAPCASCPYRGRTSAPGRSRAATAHLHPHPLQ